MQTALADEIAKGTIDIGRTQAAVILRPVARLIAGVMPDATPVFADAALSRLALIAGPKDEGVLAGQWAAANDRLAGQNLEYAQGRAEVAAMHAGSGTALKQKAIEQAVSHATRRWETKGEADDLGYMTDVFSQFIGSTTNDATKSSAVKLWTSVAQKELQAPEVERRKDAVTNIFDALHGTWSMSTAASRLLTDNADNLPLSPVEKVAFWRGANEANQASAEFNRTSAEKFGTALDELRATGPDGEQKASVLAAETIARSEPGSRLRKMAESKTDLRLVEDADGKVYTTPADQLKQVGTAQRHASISITIG